MAGTLRPEVARFALQKLPSVEHLEALETLQREPSRWWTGETLGSILGLTTANAAQILEDLCSANLLEVRVSSAVIYHYKPGSTEIEARVADVMDALRYPRAQLYTLVTSPSAHALRNFADAFRFTRKDRG